MTAGDSATPQARKLGIKPGMRVGLVNAPPDWRLSHPPPIDEIRSGAADVLLWFVRAAVDLRRAPALGRRIFPNGALWVAWPRRAAGHASDVSDARIREAVLPLGLVDVKVAAIDDDWSGLKIVWRTEHR